MHYLLIQFFMRIANKVLAKCNKKAYASKDIKVFTQDYEIIDVEN